MMRMNSVIPRAKPETHKEKEKEEEEKETDAHYRMCLPPRVVVVVRPAAIACHRASLALFSVVVASTLPSPGILVLLLILLLL